MALGRVAVTYLDGQGYQATTDVYVSIPGAGTLAEVQTELASLATLINDVTACKITKMNYSLNVDVSGLTPNAPAAGVSVDQALALSFPNATNSRPWDFIVPGLAAANIVSGGPDMTEGGAIDLLADKLEVVFGTAGITAGYYANSNYLELAPIAAGFLAKRKLARSARSRSGRVGA